MDKFQESRVYRTVPRSARSSPRRGTPETSRNGSLSRPQQFLMTPDQLNGQVSGEGIYRRRSSIAIRAVKVRGVLFVYHCFSDSLSRNISNQRAIKAVEMRQFQNKLSGCRPGEYTHQMNTCIFNSELIPLVLL